MDLTDPPDPTDPSLTTLVRVESARLSPASLKYPETTDEVSTRLLNRVKHWCKRHGYGLAGHRSDLIHDSATDITTVTVEGYCRPLTSGEWPSIHQAIRQDQADREALRRAENARDAPRLPRSPDPF